MVTGYLTPAMEVDVVQGSYVEVRTHGGNCVHTERYVPEAPGGETLKSRLRALELENERLRGLVGRRDPDWLIELRKEAL